MTRVLLVDHKRWNLEQLKIILERLDDVEIVGTITQPLEAIEIVNKTKVDIAFFETESTDGSWIDLALKLQEIQESIEIVFVTSYANYNIEAYSLRASHYLIKPVSENQVMDIIKSFEPYNSETSRNSVNYNAKALYFDYFRLVNKNGITINWLTIKMAELCAYFLLNSGEIISKRSITENIWPDIDEEEAKLNLHVTVSRLRKLIDVENLPITIETIKDSKEGYMCTIDTLDSDLKEFTRLFSTKEAFNTKDLSLFLENIKGGFLEHNHYVWSKDLQNKIKAQMIERTLEWILEVESEHLDLAIEINRSVLRIYRTDERLMLKYFTLLFRSGEVYKIRCYSADEDLNLDR